MQRIIRLIAHRDSDLALLLVLAVVSFIVQLFAGELSTILFAATICAIGVTLLRLRRSLEATSTSSDRLSQLFFAATPPELDNRLTTARELHLQGVSLDRTVRNHYAALEAYLRRGRELTVLLLDPDNAPSVAIADRRAYNEHGVEQRGGQIRFVLETLGRLQAATGGRVVVRLTSDPLSFGAIMVDADAVVETSWLLIQHYSYKKASVTEPGPMFMLDPSDGPWFLGFREEVQNLWRDASPWTGATSVSTMVADPE